MKHKRDKLPQGNGSNLIRRFLPSKYINGICLFFFSSSVYLIIGCSNPNTPQIPAGYLDVYPANGGTILVTPQKDHYKVGDTVQLTAVPYDNRSFFKWTGEIVDYNSTIFIVVQGKTALILCGLSGRSLGRQSAYNR